MTVFGEKLRQEREKRGWNQSELGKRAGITRVQVNRLENGERSPNWSTVEALCNALGVSCDVFRDKRRGKVGAKR